VSESKVDHKNENFKPNIDKHLRGGGGGGQNDFYLKLSVLCQIGTVYEVSKLCDITSDIIENIVGL
jgi:hypothetical protein